ncbi:hypothetical protein CCACVL1_23954 [Corchorus capsularis]|uniref:Non-haem dioxygenase N-terminal domain-containing protein n=1 Tax=Corchorus capsularis TaxID=210143 RepID=A0A1R3GRR1_COCAP|nr:hypothetical protein CCACVL1_23954 [Corchorus capsularis]
MATTAMNGGEIQYERVEAVKRFDESKIGVKGLVDSGLSTIPRFFIVNHGIPVQVLDRTIGSIRAFHELPTEVKARFYRRDGSTGVSFISNVDLYHSKAASWRDTLQIRLGPTLPDLEEIPEGRHVWTIFGAYFTGETGSLPAIQL